MNFDSKKYWEERYKNGGNSGLGSYGDEANFKANYINKLIKEKSIKTINDFGCGDSNQISMLTGFIEYNGFDVSSTILNKCRDKFKDDSRFSFFNEILDMQKKELCMSLDVTYHIIEDSIFEDYMNNLFNLSNKYVLIYSINSKDNDSIAIHLKHREFVEWVKENKNDFSLINVERFVKKENGVSFYLFEKI